MRFSPLSSTRMRATPEAHLLAGRHVVCRDSLCLEVAQPCPTKVVVADRAEHHRAHPGTGHRERLIRAFSAPEDRERTAGDRLTGLR